MNTTTAAQRLASAIDTRDQGERDVYAAVDDMRAEGASWTTIGTALGITRQSAWKRYGDGVAADERTFHYATTKRLAACGQRLDAENLGETARGLVKVAEQYPALTCQECAEVARPR